MAIDTREKRMSAMLPMLPFRGVLGVPDGSGADSAGQRQLVAFLYSGIAAGTPAASASTEIVVYTVYTQSTVSSIAWTKSLVADTLYTQSLFVSDLER